MVWVLLGELINQSINYLYFYLIIIYPSITYIIYIEQQIRNLKLGLKVHCPCPRVGTAGPVCPVPDRGAVRGDADRDSAGCGQHPAGALHTHHRGGPGGPVVSQSINQLINQSISQSINQSNNQ